MSGKAHGPNVRKLIVRKMAALIAPVGMPPREARAAMEGAMGGAADVGSVAREATAWVEARLAEAKALPDNPHGDDDEAIAGAILGEVERRRPDARAPR
jgi:hypothetical protein